MTTKCKPIPNYLLEKWKAEASNSQKWHGEDLAIADTRILSLIIEVEWLRKDQDDWRKGVDLIRAPLVKFAGKQLPTLCCVTISNAVLEVCAEVERLRAKCDDLTINGFSSRLRQLDDLRKENARLKEVVAGYHGSGQRIQDLSDDCGLLESTNKALGAEVERLRKEVSNFHMDYRMKCDIPIQKQLNNDGSLVEPIPENK